jgi:protein SCO1/2
MATRPVHPPVTDGGALIGDRAFTMVLVSAALLGILAVGAALLGVGSPRGGFATASTSPSPSATPIVSPGAYLSESVREAPTIELIDKDERPFSLSALRGGGPVLVFFGYTHCPDICPATIGILGKVLGEVGGSSRAVFVSIDPARDTPAWLREYAPYLPAGITMVTGPAETIRSTADAWGVRYAKVEGKTPDAYSMSHTADVFIVDASGLLRGRFPFGTTAEQMVGTLRAMLAGPAPSLSPGQLTPTPLAGPTVAPSPPASPSASPGASPSPSPVVGALRPTVVSSAVWAGGRSPVILTLDGPAGPLADKTLVVTAQLETPDRQPVGDPVTAVGVTPPYEDRVLYVPTIDVPAPGAWWLTVGTTVDGTTLSGSVALTALDPGTSAALGAAAPTARTPTLADVGGDHWAVSTDPSPELRLYQRSTTDALADHAPFVLVVDSVRFRVSPTCGKAVVLARSLIDRWPAATFIHVEPYTYAVVSETPVLEGDLSDPPLNEIASAWGLGGSPWGSRFMPWVFIVDGGGIVRAKYQGVIGSDDLDVILSLIAQGG